MKFFVLTVLALSALTAHSSETFAGPRENEFLAKIQSLALECVIQPYSIDSTGEKALLPLKSVCPEIVRENDFPRVKDSALIRIDYRSYRAVVIESRDSDGGDLNDLYILDVRGNVVALRKNTLSFNNVLLALAGGKNTFHEVRE